MSSHAHVKPYGKTICGGALIPFRLIVIYVKRVSAAVQLDPKARANADQGRNLSSSRASAVKHQLDVPVQRVPIAHLIGSFEEYEYGEASSDCSRRG